MTNATRFITQDQFAKSLTQRLDEIVETTNPNITERLRFARERALHAQKTIELHTAWSLAPQTNASFALNGRNSDLFNKLGMMIPLLALIVGLIVITQLQNDYRAKEIADVDAALLIDDLPPSAYADQGFGQFLKLQAER